MTQAGAPGLERLTEAPAKIWATINGASTRLPDGGRQLIGGWSEDADRPRAVEYVRADLAALSPAPVEPEADDESTYDEGYEEGLRDAKAHGVEVANAVQRWLDKRFVDGWYDAAQEGYTADDVIQALHEALREAARPAGAVLPVSDAMREATQHAVELEQCSLFVDSPPLAKAMTDAAAFLRALSVREPAPSPAAVVDEAMVEQACLSFFPAWNDIYTPREQARFREKMMAALVAAQNAGDEQ